MLSKAENHATLPKPAVAAKGRMTPAMHALAQWAAIDAGDKVLDMACGNGALLSLISQEMECSICGIASSVEQYRSVRAMLPNADILFAQPEDIPWKENSFDVVMCGLPFYAMEEPGKVLKEALRVLKPGGQFLLATTWYPAPLRQLYNCFSGHWEDDLQSPVLYGKHEMLATLDAVGFHNVTWRAADMRVGITIGWKKPVKKDMTEA